MRSPGAISAASSVRAQRLRAPDPSKAAAPMPADELSRKRRRVELAADSEGEALSFRLMRATPSSAPNRGSRSRSPPGGAQARRRRHPASRHSAPSERAELLHLKALAAPSSRTDRTRQRTPRSRDRATEL